MTEGLSPGAQKIYRRMKAQGATSAPSSVPDVRSQFWGRGNPGNEIPDRDYGWGMDKEGKATNPVSWALDILSRPNYAVAQTVADVSADPDWHDALTAPAQFLGNLGDNDKRSISDLFRGETFDTDSGKKWTSPNEFLAAEESDDYSTKLAKGVLGFGADVALDPSTYIGAGAIRGAAKGLQKSAGAISDLARGGRATDEAAEAVTPAAPPQAAEVAPGRPITPAPVSQSQPAPQALREPQAAPETAPLPAPISGTTVQDALDISVPRIPRQTENVVEELPEVTPQPTSLFDIMDGKYALPPEQIEEVLSAIRPVGGGEALTTRAGNIVTPEMAAGRNALAENDIVKYSTQGLKDETGRMLTPFARGAQQADEIPVAQVDEAIDTVEEARLTDEDIEFIDADFDNFWAQKKAEFRAQDQWDDLTDVVDDVIKQSGNLTDARAQRSLMQNIVSTMSKPENFGKMEVGAVVNGEEVWRPISEWVDTLKRASAGEDVGIPAEVLKKEIYDKWINPKVRTTAVSRWLKETDIFNSVRQARLAAREELEDQTLAARGMQIADGKPDVIDAPAAIQAAKAETPDPYVWKSSEEQEVVKAQYAAILEPEHFQHLYASEYLDDAALTNEQKLKQFQARLRNIFRSRGARVSTRKRYEVFNMTRIVEKPREFVEGVPANQVTSTVARQETASEIIEKTPKKSAQQVEDRMIEARRIAEGDELEDFEKHILLATVDNKNIRGQQWSGRAPEFQWTTKTGTARNADKPGEGLGINIESFNAKAQANLFRNLIDHYSPEWAASGKPLWDFGREGEMMRNVMTSFVKIENFLRANDIPITAGNGLSGIPISFGDVVKAFIETSDGRHFLETRIFSPIGRTYGTNKNPGTIYVDGFLRAMGIVTQVLTDPAVVNAARNVVAGTTMRGIPAPARIDLEAIVREAVKGGKVLDEDRLYLAFTNEGQTPLSAWRAASKGGPYELDEGTFGPASKVVIDEALNVLFGKGKVEIHPPLPAKVRKQQVSQVLEGRSAGDLDPLVTANKIESGDYFLDESGELIYRFADEDFDTTILARIAAVAQHRAAQAGIEFGEEVGQVSTANIDRVLSILDEDRFGPSDLTQILSDDGLKKLAAQNAANQAFIPKVRQKKVSDASVGVTKEELTDVVAEVDFKHININADTQKIIYRELPGIDGPTPSPFSGNHTEAVAKVRDNAAKNAEAERVDAEDIAKAMGETYDADQLTAGMVDRIAYKAMVGEGTFAKGVRNIANHLNFPAFHRGLMKNVSLAAGLNAAWAEELNKIQRLGSMAEIKMAFNLARLGDKSTTSASPRIMELRDMLAEKLDFFSTVDKSAGKTTVMSQILDRGIGLEHWINTLNDSHYGLKELQKFTRPDGWDNLTLAAQTELFTKHLRNADVAIDDPIEYLMKIHAATSSVVRDMSLSQEAQNVLKAIGGISKNPQRGFVKVSDELWDDNLILRYFTDRDVYIDSVLAKQIIRLSANLSNPAKFKGELGKFLDEVYDPIQMMWKSGMTIYRPGHHIRNLVGDMSLSFLMDGVKNPRAYYKAMAMLAQAPVKYDSFDYLKMIQGIPPKVQAGKGMKARVVLRHKGGRTEYSDGDLVEKLTGMGLFKSFALGEDITATNTADWLKKIQESLKITGGRVRETAGGVAEARDHFVRLAHALDIIEKGKITGRWFKPDLHARNFKNPDDFLKEVVRRVNQTHPDGSDLTPWERKYMRRVIPFYSWTRKSIPVVLEGMVMNPSRVLVVPKAQYNIAHQMGVEPESLSDPFPRDQLFPSWLRDSTVGPLWRDEQSQYWGTSPGFVDQDILSLLMNPGNEALNMVSPLIKTGPELLSGKTWAADGDGINIPSSSEYIGRQIPGVSHLQSLSGYNVLGSLNGPEAINSVERGNRDTWSSTHVLNALLGIGSTNMSTPSAINSAEIELRDRLRNGN